MYSHYHNIQLYHHIQSSPHKNKTTTTTITTTTTTPQCKLQFVHIRLCALVNVLVLQGKTPPVQVAQCQDHLGHKYRSGMQQPNAGSTRARSALRWCPCASCIWLLHPAPILVPKMVLTLCNLRWWCFSFHQLAQILYLHSWWSSFTATCTGGVFPWSTCIICNITRPNHVAAS